VGFQYGSSSTTGIGHDDPKEHQVWQDIQYSAPQIDVSKLKAAAQQQGISGSTVQSIMSLLNQHGPSGAQYGQLAGNYAAAGSSTPVYGESGYPSAIPVTGYSGGISDIGYPPGVAQDARYNGNFYGGTWWEPGNQSRQADAESFAGQWSGVPRSYWRGTAGVMPVGGMGRVMAAPRVMPPRPFPPPRIPGYAQGGIVASGGDAPGGMTALDIPPANMGGQFDLGAIGGNPDYREGQWAESYTPHELNQLQQLYDQTSNFAMYQPPAGSLGFGQGPTMIPSQFNAQGYPIAQAVFGGGGPGSDVNVNPGYLMHSGTVKKPS
jgi:hypothetical protein